MHRWLVIGLTCCSTVQAGHVNEPAKDWQELRAKNLHMGLSVEHVDRTLGECRKNQLSVSRAEDLLCPVYTAHAEELPADCVFLKIEEGLAKGIPWKDVHAAADRRLVCLRKADGLIMEVRERRGGQHAHLVSHTCLALESGLSEEALVILFSRPEGFRYGRLIHVVEAGESLKLAGLSSENTLEIMNECLKRNLTGVEVFRVVDVVKMKLSEGSDFETVSQTLWLAAGN